MKRHRKEPLQNVKKAILTDRLILNPDIPITKQAAVINQVIADSGMERQMH